MDYLDLINYLVLFDDLIDYLTFLITLLII